MQTLLVDTIAWDLLIDSSGNIAVASDPYAQAQDVASAVKTFLGEVYYNTLLGVPYFGDILGQAPPLSLIKSYFVTAAKTVPNVETAVCFISSFVNRHLGGQIQVTNSAGQTQVTSF